MRVWRYYSDMMYRGVYRDGVIVLQGDVDLENGQAVHVQPAPRAAKRNKKTSTKAKPSQPSRRSGKPTRAQIEAGLAAFGVWKGRKEWKGKTAVEITQELRERALGGFGKRRG